MVAGVSIVELESSVTGAGVCPGRHVYQSYTKTMIKLTQTVYSCQWLYLTVSCACNMQLIS